MARVGRYIHKIELQTFTTAKNAAGEETKTWSTAATQMGRVSPVSGRAFFQASAERAEITHEIRTRYNPEITIKSRDRVVFRTRNFEIRSVINWEERNREWILMCVEKVHTDDE